MKMRVMALKQLSALAAAALVAGACADPAAPRAVRVTAEDPNLAITSIRTDISNFPAGLGEGEHRLCKAANAGAPQQVFSFSVSRSGGTPEVHALAPGQCVDLTFAPGLKGGAVFEFLTITEAAPAANWVLGDIDITRYIPTFFPNYQPPAGAINSYDVNTRTATVAVNADYSTVVTFNNVYTPPPPSIGCTYTQGYWKNHSAAGPAPYDDGWKALAGGLEHNTIFYSSGKTWLALFRTPVRGSAYVSLAHQYMAAKLNVLNGAAAPTNVLAALATAESYFGGSSVSITGLASLLDEYNNGRLGTPHCGSTVD